jgi:hypothetical protein
MTAVVSGRNTTAMAKASAPETVIAGLDPAILAAAAGPHRCPGRARA